MVQARHVQRSALLHIAYRVFEVGEHRRTLLRREVGHMKTEERLQDPETDVAQRAAQQMTEHAFQFAMHGALAKHMRTSAQGGGNPGGLAEHPALVVEPE